MLVLKRASKTVHDKVSSQVRIKDWVEPIDLAMLDQSYNRERVCVVSSNQTDAVDKHKRPEQ